MTKKGVSKEKRAVSALVDALQTGFLHQEDFDRACLILSQSMPDAARLPAPALRLLARNSLRQAWRIVSTRSSENSLTTPLMQTPDTDQKQHPLASDVPGTNQPVTSSDLLPAIRPETPIHPVSQSSKKRRLSRLSLHGSEAMDPFQKTSHSFQISRPCERFEDVGGISSILQSIRELVEWPLAHGALYSHLGVSPPKGILLHGPPGCGKTMVANAIAGELGVSFFRISGPEIVSGMSGESEKKLRDLFGEALREQPSIIFIDEIDAIASKREGASKDMERRIVSQLLSCIDGLSSRTKKHSTESAKVNIQPLDKVQEDKKYSDPGTLGTVRENLFTSVIVIGATNRPESLEPALRRAGRFDREIEIGAPDAEARLAILQKLCRNMRIEKDCNLQLIAKETAGYVGADLHLLTREAGLACMRRLAQRSESKSWFRENIMQKEQSTVTDEIPKELLGCKIETCDVQKALMTTQPSALREGFATRPNVSWADIGSLEEVRSEMMMAIVQPIKRPELFISLGLNAPAGVLLYGPPGCGKTLLAKAVASESGANFISVKGPELLSKFVGDSELAVRKVFARARSSSPCVIFFDELDALAPRRSSGGSSDSSGASERVVNMLLTEMDGFLERKQVFLIAATNRPDIIDPAMLRPGRLDKLVYVALPDEKGRASILKTLLKKVKVSSSVDVEWLAKHKCCAGYSGADLQALIRSAGEAALKDAMIEESDCNFIQIEQKHFEDAFLKVFPSVSRRDAERYKKLAHRLQNTRGHLED